MSGRPYEGLFLRVEGTKRPISFRLRELPSPLEYSGPAEVALYREKTNTEGLTEAVVVATVTLPRSGSYLLAFSGPGESPEVHAIPYPTDDFPIDSARFLNATDQDLYIRYGSGNFTLPAGNGWSQARSYADFIKQEREIEIVEVQGTGADVTETHKNTRYFVSDIHMGVAVRESGSLRLVLEKQISLNENKRLSFILFRDPRSESTSPTYRMRTLVESPPKTTVRGDTTAE